MGCELLGLEERCANLGVKGLFVARNNAGAHFFVFGNTVELSCGLKRKRVVVSPHGSGDRNCALQIQIGFVCFAQVGHVDIQNEGGVEFLGPFKMLHGELVILDRRLDFVNLQQIIAGLRRIGTAFLRLGA